MSVACREALTGSAHQVKGRERRGSRRGRPRRRRIGCTTSTRRRSWREAVHDRPAPGAHRHRRRRPRGGDRVLRRTRARIGGRGVRRGRLGRPHKRARGRAGGCRDPADPGWQRQGRAGQVPLALIRGRRRAGAGQRAGHPPHPLRRRRRRGIPRRPASAWRRAGRRAGELREQLLALLRARPGGNHRRAGEEDRLMGVPLFGQEHVDRYRESDGEEGHDWQGTTVLLLTTTGRNSGAKRTTPLIYQRHGDDYLVVASNGGGDPPGWFLNLQDDPIVAVQVKADHHTARARIATAEEKPELWRIMTATGVPYDEFQEKAGREIPVVVLEPG